MAVAGTWVGCELGWFLFQFQPLVRQGRTGRFVLDTGMARHKQVSGQTQQHGAGWVLVWLQDRGVDYTGG